MPELTSRRQFTLTGGQTLVVDTGISGVSDYSQIMIVPLAPTAAWSQVTIDTNPTSAGVTMTNTGSGTVVLNAMFMYPHPMMGSQVSNSYLGASENVAEPASYVNDFNIRQFSSFVNPFMVNLAANPALRASKWGNSTVQCLTQDFTGFRLGELSTAMAAAAALPTPMPIYPGARVFPGVTQPFSDWCSLSYWTQYATDFATLLAMRPAGESRIGIDAESYGIGGDPTINSLTSNGFTLLQFQTAIQPFIDVMVSSGATVCIYPASIATSINVLHQLIVQLLYALGPERIEIWWYDSFNSNESYRLQPHTQWAGTVSAMQANEAGFEQAVGIRGLKHRHVVDDDIYRNWGVPLLTNSINSYGTIRPWVFDITRIDRTSMGTQAWIDGTTLKSANNIKYLFRWAATWNINQVANVTSEGLAATPVITELSRCTASGVSAGYSPDASLSGYILKHPGASFLFGCVRIQGVLPTVAGTAFMVDFPCKLPSTLVADAAILSGSQFNSSTWNVYFKFSTGEIILQLRNGAAKTELVAMTGVAPGDTIRIQIGRTGDTWLYTGGSQAINRTLVGHAVGVTSIGLLVLGGGIDPTAFPANNNQAGCVDLLLIAGATGQVAIYDYLPTDSEITSQMRGEEYPYGRGL